MADEQARDVHAAARDGFAAEADAYSRGRPDYPAALLGWLGDKLGRFYAQNKEHSRETVRRHAIDYFRECAALVRPVESAPPAITGTVDDRWVHMCWSDDSADTKPWALLLYVRTADMTHTALVPAFEHEAGAVRFAQFLENPGTSFDASIGQFCGSYWTVDKERRKVSWPATDL